MGDVPYLVRLRLVAEGGVHHACCSQRCATALFSAQPADREVRPGVAALWPYGACAHCGWCGDLVCVPRAPCRIHEAGCPMFRWEFTHTGLRALLEVRERAGVGRFTPRALAAFTEVAALLRDAHRWPDRQALVDGVLDRRVDWLT